jgi:hypothetical protein
LITYQRLELILTSRLECRHSLLIESDATTDPRDGNPTPALHSFERFSNGRLLIGIIEVWHERLPLPMSVLRSLLNQLDLTDSDLDG